MNRLVVGLALGLLLIALHTASAQSAATGSAVPVWKGTLFTQSQHSDNTRIISGVILSPQNELVPGVTVIGRSASGERRTTSDAEGHFRLSVPDGVVTL